MSLPAISAATLPPLAPPKAASPGWPKPGPGRVAGLVPWPGRRPASGGDPALFFAGGDPALFFTDPVLNQQVLSVLGAAGYGAAEYGEVAAAIAATHRGGDSYEACYRAFRSLGQQISGQGRAALATRNPVAARGAFLRAARYLATALHVALGTGHPRWQAAAYRAMDANWALAAGLLEPAAEPVRIRSGRNLLPGWLLRPRAAAGRPAARPPAVIFTDGGDAQHAGLYVAGAAEALSLGYCALLLEGPGQGSLLYLRGTGLRPDWESVITPAVDFLAGRGGADPGRIALIGTGLGGALAARAAAHEHRLAALVLDPGVTDALAALRLPAPLAGLALSGHPGEADAAWAEIAPRLPASVRFRVAKAGYPFRQPCFSALVAELGHYRTEAYLPLITTPTLVIGDEADAGYPGQGRLASQLLRCPHASHEFGPADTGRTGTPVPPHRRNQVIFDWLRTVLA
jgi:hypothetical protein